jgi:hypothetical protein
LRGRVIVSTLPTGQPDAISRAVPETDQFLILFDPTFFEFLYRLSNDFAELIDPDKMRQEAMRYMATGQERPLSESIRYAEHRSLNESFASTLMTFLEKGTAPPPRPFDDRAFQLAEHLRSTALIFVVAHEYAHILLGHLKPDKIGLRSVHAGPKSAEWQDELAADRLAFGVSDAALSGRRLVRAVHFMGTDCFFLCVMLLNLGLDVLSSGRSVSLTDMADPSRLTDSQLATSHPIPSLRLAHLHYWEESKFPLNEYRGMEYHAAVLIEVASQAWLGVRPGLLRMHATGVKPAASWTGLDIFEHQ